MLMFQIQNSFSLKIGGSSNTKDFRGVLCWSVFNRLFSILEGVLVPFKNWSNLRPWVRKSFEKIEFSQKDIKDVSTQSLGMRLEKGLYQVLMT